MLTEKLIANIMLLYKLSKQPLVLTIFVGNLRARKDLEISACTLTGHTYRGIPENTAKLHGFQKNRLRLFKIEVATHAIVEAHSTKAGNGHLLVTKWECLDHLGRF